MLLPERKRIRLKSAAYSRAGAAFSITIGTLGRFPIFEDQAFGLECVELLRQLRSDKVPKVYAFCLMPDHVHLLLAASRETPIPSLVGRWKSRCYQARLARGKKEPFWQRSFYDHGLRGDEDLRRASRYILENPVRAGIVTDFHDYPLCGSLEFEL